MARGWESKSVEEQQSEANQRPERSNANKSPEQIRRDTHRRSLELQRAHVEAQLKTSENPRFVELMQRELEHLDAELEKIAAESKRP